MVKARQRVWVLVLVAGLLTGCANGPIQRKDGRQSQRGFVIENLAKSDVDQMTEIHQREVLRHLRVLTEKLYRRNPAEFRKAGLPSVEVATEQLFMNLAIWPTSPLRQIGRAHV